MEVLNFTLGRRVYRFDPLIGVGQCSCKTFPYDNTGTPDQVKAAAKAAFIECENCLRVRLRGGVD